MHPRITTSLLRPTLVALVLALSAGSALARTVTATYTAPNLSISVDTNGNEPYDRLDIPCKCTDTVGAPNGFTTAAPWSVDPTIRNDNGRCSVRLIRTPSIDSDEKVTLTHPANWLARGNQGTINVSLAGANLNGSGTKTMLSTAAPGLGAGGTAVLILMLVAAGAYMTRRMRKATVA